MNGRSEPVVCQFFGGPWDGSIRKMTHKAERIDLLAQAPQSGTPNRSPIRWGAYWLTHTRFGDAWRYEWREPSE